jgi:hypothetical protein
MAQRAFIERAAELVASLPGPAMQVGWGDGAAYDHLREVLRRREIIVFDRPPGPTGETAPPAERCVIGDPRETLPLAWDRLPRRIALAHLNFAPSDSPRQAAALAPLIAPLLCPGAIVVSELPIELPGWQPLPPPDGLRAGRHHLYRAS